MAQVFDERAALDAALFRIGVQLGEEQKTLLLEHLHLLVKKNESLNLTRITNMEDAIVRHLEDSLSVLPEFEECGGVFCDIGTGGGFPGIPLGIASGRPGVLLDSVKKKAAAVREFVHELGLESQLEVCGLRSEELAIQRPESFDVVLARAVSSLASVEELATPLLKRGGKFIAMRGHDSGEELLFGKNAASKLGLELCSKRTFSVGPDGEGRSVYVFEKVGDPQVKLPRRPGMAQKRPLR